MGWAFGLVDTKAGVPDLVFATNGGGGQIGFGLYRYVGERYVVHACETLTKKDRAGYKANNKIRFGEVRNHEILK